MQLLGKYNHAFIRHYTFLVLLTEIFGPYAQLLAICVLKQYFSKT